jgi:hypothetical protein
MATAEPVKRTMVQHALDYWRAGLPVFPICTPLMVGHQHRDPDTRQLYTCEKDSLGKTPLVRWGGYQNVLPTEEEIRRWWSEWPNANIGLATGSLSGILVLDADGTEARKECLRLGGLDDTPTVWTGKIGGAHFHLKYPGGDVRNFARKLAGTDMRAQGGYVLMPPSLHASGNSYRWAENTRSRDHADVPEWLTQLIEEGNAIAGDMASGRVFDLSDVLTGVKQGERDDKLFRYACSLRSQDVPQDEAEALLRAAALACVPAFSEEAAVGKVRRAYKVYPAPLHPTVQFDEEIIPQRTHLRLVTDRPAETAPGAVFLRPISELLAMEEVEPDWMVDQLFTVGSNGWVAAEAKVGKSWTVLDLVYALSTGTPFLGRFAVKQPRRVIYIQEEDPVQRVLRRLKQLLRGDPSRKPPPDENLLWSVRAGFKLDNLEWMEKLRQEIIAFSAEVIVLDVFNRLHGSDDSKQAEMTAILNLLTRLTNDYGCSFIIVHHNKKTQAGVETRANQMMRGSTVLAGWSECSLYLRKAREKHVFIVTPESKDAPEIDDFTVTIRDLENGGVVLDIGTVSVTERTSKIDGDIVSAVDRLTKEGQDATVQRIAAILGKDRTTVQKRMKGLVEEGLLDEDEVQFGRTLVKIYTLVTL